MVLNKHPENKSGILYKRKIKVFHGLVNYGTQAGLFARELRKSGIKAISAAFPDPFQRVIDITLLHGGNYFQKILRHSWNSLFLITCFFKYNTFHFYYGTTLTRAHWDLPFYKLFRKKIVFHYLGNDVQLYKDSTGENDITNMVGFLNKRDVAEYNNVIKKRLKYESKYSDLQIVCGPNLSEFVPGSIVLPLAIDLNEFKYSPMAERKQEFVIMHAPTDRASKGTSIILETIDQLIRDGFNIKKVLVENVPHKDLQERYKECDIFIDQILSGWYGTAAIEAMASGRAVVCFLRDEYYQYINYKDDIPIINSTPGSLYNVIKNLINNRDRLPEIALKSREFVEKIHDVKKISNVLISYYGDI